MSDMMSGAEQTPAKLKEKLRLAEWRERAWPMLESALVFGFVLYLMEPLFRGPAGWLDKAVFALLD